MLPRTLEPEVMDSDDEAREYDAMDHAVVNAAFVDDLLATCERAGLTGPTQEAVSKREGEAPAEPHGFCADKMETGFAVEVGTIDRPSGSAGASPSRLPDLKRLQETDQRLEFLDCGTGTARIPIVLAGRLPAAFVTAIDLSTSMLALAEENVRAAGLASQIVLRRADGNRLPYDDGAFDAVVSNSTIHHLADPLPALVEMRRLVRCGGVLFVRDLARPSTGDEVNRLVATYAAGETPLQQKLLRDSLHAALTLAEIRDFVRQIGLAESMVTMTSDRHWTLAGTVPHTAR